MRTKQKLLSTMMLMACSGLSSQAHAVLPPGAVLQFDAGVTTIDSSSNAFVKSGSYFGMDNDSNGKIPGLERTAISQNAGLAIGKTQAASGSHSGPTTGAESAGIDNPWSFFANTGLHWTQAPVNVIADDGAGNVTIDLSGWVVAWNGVQTIPMDSKAWEAGFTDGEALLVCGTDCSDGDTYTLDYSATVPADCACGFENVPYHLHLTGTISIPPDPATDATGGFTPGAIATAVSSANGRISMDELIDNGGVADPDFTYGDGLTDFTVSGTGASSQIVLTLTAPIPAAPVLAEGQPPTPVVYRKFSNGAWNTFTADTNNLVASAAAISQFQCPPPGDALYNHSNGLVEGDECLQLTIADGGPYDDSGTANTIADPGGVARPLKIFIDKRTSGSDGCSMSGNTISSNQRADWWLVAGFMGLLGLFRLKRNSHNNRA